MVDVSDLRVCTDCGNVYSAKYSKVLCPVCKTNNKEKITDNSGSF